MNDAHRDLVSVILGAAAILIFASALGWALARRYAPDGGNATIANLNDRIRAWWVMVVVLAAAMLAGARAMASRSTARGILGRLPASLPLRVQNSSTYQSGSILTPRVRSSLRISAWMRAE